MAIAMATKMRKNGAQSFSLKDVMGQQPMTLKEYPRVPGRRVAVRRQMEDLRLRRLLDEAK